MSVFRYAQSRYLLLVLLFWLVVFFCTRTVLLVMHWGDANLELVNVPGLYAVGLIYDLAFLVYAALPLSLYLFLVPRRFWSRRWHRGLMYGLFASSVFVMLFVAASEWIFWDEFGVRFNFIAVDYLVYSQEVVQNILESYPVIPLLSGLAVAAIVATLMLRRQINAALQSPTLGWGKAGVLILAGSVLVVGVTAAVNQHFPGNVGANVYLNELARNGPYQFFSAFRNNELDYTQLYATLPDEKVAAVLRAEIGETNARFIGSDPLDIRREITNPGDPRHLNVILVTIESLSAKYLGSFGDERGLTPNLDILRRESLFFNNFYATGTRTDRGLEAITLSIPPTPGRSIVKRIGRESGYASLGEQFNAKGYDSAFIYGGRGYFDNMNAFFSGNGYRIVDQSRVPESEMHFTNAWGMSDEDLYMQALKQADAGFASGRPFFLQLMTTSNHRPYTYPDGRIDIPSGKGRDGAVKYTDYAIGQFLAQARERPWFNETVFIFVADHTAGSAGKEDLPVANYRIPLFIYAPAIISPREFSGLASQIDIAPTLLGLLNFDYTSTFFGRNVLREDAPPGRALIGNYQHLGLFDGDSLVILSPRQGIRRHDDPLGQSKESVSTIEDPLVQRNIAYYQGASYSFKHGLLRWH